jgi:hypothetical protein
MEKRAALRPLQRGLLRAILLAIGLSLAEVLGGRIALSLDTAWAFCR